MKHLILQLDMLSASKLELERKLRKLWSDSLLYHAFPAYNIVYSVTDRWLV